MSITVKLDLPAEVAEKVRAAGLLEPQRVSQMLAEELRRYQERAELQKSVHRARECPGEPMDAGEIESEIKAVRAGRRRQRESGN
jgi:hypothetical protein